MAKAPKKTPPAVINEQVLAQVETKKPSHLWAKGQSGNPGGRPKGLAAAIRETWPAERLQHAFTEIAENPKTSNRDRMEALRWLGERGYGRTPEVHMVGALNEEQRDAAAELTRDQLLALLDTTDTVDVPLAALPAQGIEDAELVS